MRLPARQGRKDANHGEIVKAFERVGCRVIDLSRLGGGVPDLLVSLRNGCRRELILVEVKTAAGKLNARQRAFEADGWEVYTVRSVDEALKVVGIQSEPSIEPGQLRMAKASLKQKTGAA